MNERKHVSQTPENHIQFKNFVIDNSDVTVYDIISKLLFLSKIKEGEKINTEDFYVEETSWFTTLRRTFFRNQSRTKTLEFIKNLTDSALDIASKCSSSNVDLHRNIGNYIIDSLEQSKTGLLNLTKTYEDDRMFVSKMQTLIGILDEKINVFKK
jgi:hypothetical protein